ncbi:MAG TPA: hypothetical protein VK206_05460, partial [Anaerolineales bacterium]|nr:hypothetical protein [Anaerolineales bacterium]
MPKRRGISRTNASATLLLLIVLFVLGVYYSLTGNDLGGIFGTGNVTPTIGIAISPSPVVNAPTSVNASGT